MTSPDRPGIVRVQDIGEHALIARIRAKVPAPPAFVLVGIGDDAAVVEPARGLVDVLTTDACVEGVHFDQRFSPPDAIGHRALAANLSDLAAMGASPRVALLSLMLPDALPVDVVDGILDGLLALAAEAKAELVGGNITRSPGPLIVDVTAIGSVARRKVLTRGGAKPGDDVYVTGTIGGARAGLAMLQAGAAPSDELQAGCRARYLRPAPRVRIGRQLGRVRAATACMDLSDGLADAVRQVCDASGAGAIIEAGALPIDPGATAWSEAHGEDAVRAAVGGGDDYELLFTVPRRFRGRLRAVRAVAGDVAITRIGAITERREIRLRRGGVDETWPAGFEHFA